MHIEFLIEEPSSEAFLQGLLPKIVPHGTSWKSIVFQGKIDLLNKLEARLKGYRTWIPDDWRIVVLLDEDREDCLILKQKMENAARAAGLATKSRPQAGGRFTVLNRIAIEELEAWLFGDVSALTAAYGRISPHLGSRAAYRDPDAITGGTWEALEREFQRAGYFVAGLPKIEVSRTLAAHMDPKRNTSKSFRCFVSGLTALHS